MNQHNVVFYAVNFFCCTQSIVNRKLAGFSSGHDFTDFVQSVTVYHFLQVGNPPFNAGDDDPINSRMILKSFQGMYNDRFPMNKKKLLRTIFGIHSTTHAPSKYNSNIQNNAPRKSTIPKINFCNKVPLAFLRWGNLHIVSKKTF